MKKNIILFFFSCSFVYAQNCSCDHLIEPAVTDVNGLVLSISPGDTICIQGGIRDRIKFRNIAGTASEPVTVINCNGQVLIDPVTFSYGVKVENCNFMRLTGSGDPAIEYGFKIQGTTGYGMDLGKLTNHFEIDHFEFENTGNYAIYYNNDPACDLSANKGFFTLEDVHVHHLHIFNCSKGIRFGNLNYGPGVVNPDCGLLEPHSIEELSLTNLLIETITDGDAIRLYGAEAYIGQSIIQTVNGRGITVGTSCNVVVEQNQIMFTTNEGFRALGNGQAEIHNTIFYSNGDATHQAIELAFENTGSGDWGNNIILSNNTIVNSPQHNFSVLAPENATVVCIIRNNVFLNPGAVTDNAYPHSPFLNLTNQDNFLLQNNVFSTDETTLEFMDYNGLNFHLQADSPLINAGADALTETDQGGDARTLAGVPDAGAFEYVPQQLSYFSQIELHGLYVNDFKYILGDEVAENALLAYARDSGFNYLLLYNLTYIHNNLYDLTNAETAIVFADFIEKAKVEYGMVQIGVVGETNNSFDKIELFNNLYNSNWYQTVDVLNLEFEFWANPSGSTFNYYCAEYLTPHFLPCTNDGAFTFYLNEMQAMDGRAVTMDVISEIYLGNPTVQQMATVSENCDRVLLHYYRTSDVYTNGNSIYNYKPERIREIAQSNRKPAVMPIFSGGPGYMQTWLETHSLQDPMNTWLYGQNAFDDDLTGVHELSISGYQWYRYTDLVPAENRAAETNDYAENSEDGIQTTNSPDEKFGEISFSLYPNPLDESATLCIGNASETGYTVLLTDLVGQRIYEQFMTGSHLQMDRNNLSCGIYLLLVLDSSTGQELYQERLVVE